MPSKKWLLCWVSLALACATAREPSLILTVDTSAMGTKKHIELKDRAYTVTVVIASKDGRVGTSSREGKLSKETYATLLRLMEGLKTAELKDSYMDRKLALPLITSTAVGWTFQGLKKNILIVGEAVPKDLSPILDLLLPLMYT
jgi:hypothetical protein